MTNMYNFAVLLATFVASVNAACLSHCSICAIGSLCTQCESSYILFFGTCSKCPASCNSCNGYNCTSCTTYRYGRNCQYSCPINCLNDCHIETGFCTQCKNGLYGTVCKKDCSLCKDGECDLRACKYGCKSGYYELDNDCHKCSSNCKSCNSNTKCSVCNDGFYLQDYYIDNNINTYCRKCSKNDALCQSDCGLENCNKCQFQGVSPKCSECKGDFFTTTCDVECPLSCSKVTGQKTCDIHDGHCLNECNYTNWGAFCNNSCSDGCADNSMSRVCEREDGKCMNGCKAGFTGYKCDITNTTTATTSAHKQSGSNATDGKVITNVISNTTAATKATTPGFNEMTEAVTQEITTTVVIASAAAGGVVLLILVAVVILCFVKRRKKSDGNGGSDEAVIQHGQEVKAKQEEISIKHYPIPEAEDYIYAQPNKPRKNQKPKKTEIRAPHKLYDNVAIDLEDEQGNTADDDKTVLENIDEETTSFIETEVKPPTTDIYYNTSSLIRSRIQVSDLLECTRKKNDYAKEFENLPTGLTRTCNEALKPFNVAKNRYNGIYAYDATRVVLQSNDFINANYIDGHKKSPAYIASLGPTKSTMNNFVTFWEMVWQENTDKIIMLTNLEELEKMKCEQYWPGQGTNNIYGGYKVTCTAEKAFAEFVVRDFTIKRKSETRKVTQYHYTAWPDKTVPHNISSLVEFRDKVEENVSQSAGPVVVHCSAGIGRTGTYIALDILIREGKEEKSVDIYGCVIALRGQRVHMVQNLEQYVFLHHCVLYALTCDPDSLPVTAVPHFFTDERISTQFQAFSDLRILLRNKPGIRNKSRKENRKGADIPDEDHRVRLTLTTHDYINAVYINGYEKTGKFIAAQSPLPNTVEDFVSMLYQERCSCVVCLDQENIVDKTVGQYLPPANKVSMFGHFQVACLKSDPKDNFVIRELKISRVGSPSSEDLNIRHYQFRGWDVSESVPRSKPFLKLIVDVENSVKHHSFKQPVVVHCLNGAKRSSLFCVVSILFEKLTIEKELSVLNTICQVCSRRRSAFQDIECFRFCYDCITEMLEMAESNTYYNINNE